MKLNRTQRKTQILKELKQMFTTAFFYHIASSVLWGSNAKTSWQCKANSAVHGSDKCSFVLDPFCITINYALREPLIQRPVFTTQIMCHETRNNSLVSDFFFIFIFSVQNLPDETPKCHLFNRTKGWIYDWTFKFINFFIPTTSTFHIKVATFRETDGVMLC